MSWTLIIFMLATPTTTAYSTASAVSVPGFATQAECLQAKADVQATPFEVNAMFKTAENSVLATCVQQTVAP